MFKKAVTKNIYRLATMTVFPVQPRVNVPGLLALSESALTLTVRVLRKARRKFHYLKSSRGGTAPQSRACDAPNWVAVAVMFLSSLNLREVLLRSPKNRRHRCARSAAAPPLAELWSCWQHKFAAGSGGGEITCCMWRATHSDFA